MKMPKLPKLPKIAFPRRQKRLQATTASRRAPAADDYYEDEPKTNLSSAFIVVLILHVVAVGGIYAFNSIKAARRGEERIQTPVAASTAGTPLAVKASTPAPIPSERAAPEPTPAKALAASVPPATKSNVHKVQANENLTKIAAQHGVTVADLEEANGIKPATTLAVGQTLTIPSAKTMSKTAATAVAPDVRKTAFLAGKTKASPTVAATAKPGSRTYIVAKDDTPTSIAKKFGTTPEALMKLNRIEDPKKMQLGQTLVLPSRKTK